MLKSLFGELVPPKDSMDRRLPDFAPRSEFASTAVMETILGEAPPDQAAADRHVHDLLVTGSATQAIRLHLAKARSAQADTRRIITLLDPMRLWSCAVVKALSDASGQPIDKLMVRDRMTQDLLARIERTVLPRRQDETLKVYAAEVQIQGSEASGIGLALAERSDLTALIFGSIAATLLDDLLAALLKAARSEQWRCGHLLFMLPAEAVWISQKIDAQPWPASVRIVVLMEPLTSASTVWNKLLACWDQIRSGAEQSRLIPPAPSVAASVAAAPPALVQARVTPFPQRQAVAASVPVPPKPGVEAKPVLIKQVSAPARRAALDPERAGAILHELMLLEGLIFVALVDSSTVQVVACEGRGIDIDRAAAAATEVMRVHRGTLRQMGHWRPNEPVDEILVTVGNRYHVMRTLQAHPDLFIFAALDKLRSNLAMTRFRIMEAQQVLS